ncbi:MAG: type II secretion system protein GspD, partial [bacterium]
SDRGRVTVSSSTNSLVVTDVPGVLEAVEELLDGLDQETPEVTISAKIIFVNRTDLEDLGIVYDLRDSEVTGLEAPSSPPLDQFDLIGDEVVDPGTGVAIRGDAIAAVGRAGEVVSDASFNLITQMVLGRFSLLSFVSALESVQLTDIQAVPQVRVLDNRPARIQVGETTPVRGVQQQQQQEEGLFFGPPQVEFVETGIILEVTPTVTAGNLIFMDLRAERSGVEEVGLELGFRFNTQEAETQVLVEDGETVVIGGLTVTEVEERSVGIPILHRLPVIGRLFGQTSETRTQQDLIILVTPQITRR